MFSSKRANLLLAVVFAASSLMFVIASYSINDANAESKISKPPLKSKILRRKDRLKLKLDADELALLRKQGSPQEEREVEDKIPKHVPIKVKLKADKEKKFKDLGNAGWYRDFELEVTNTGDKPIYFLELWLVYPEVKSGNGAPVGVPLRYGRMHFIDHETVALPADVPIKPKETYVFKIPATDQKGWEWHKIHENRPDPKKVLLRFVQLSFGDGTGFGTTEAKPYPYRKDRTSAIPCREGPVPIVAQGGALKNRPIGFQPTLSKLLSKITGNPSAGYFSAVNGSHSFLGNSSLVPDLCCGPGCYSMRESMDSCSCGPSRGNLYSVCSAAGAVCGTPEQISRDCAEYGVGCPEFTIVPCATAPTPLPTPTPTPTPPASPTPTPCPPGSFDPDADGSCPYYANKVNGCCLCQVRDTECDRFGQGDNCGWVEHLCDCYNAFGPCAENPLPTPTPSGGGATYRGEYYADPGFYYGYYAYYDQCTVYVWVTYVSNDGGETWEETGEVEYAGCW